MLFFEINRLNDYNNYMQKDNYIIKCPDDLTGLNHKIKVFCAGPI